MYLDNLALGFVLNLIKEVNRFKKQCKTNYTDNCQYYGDHIYFNLGA